MIRHDYGLHANLPTFFCVLHSLMPFKIIGWSQSAWRKLNSSQLWLGFGSFQGVLDWSSVRGCSGLVFGIGIGLMPCAKRFGSVRVLWVGSHPSARRSGSVIEHEQHPETHIIKLGSKARKCCKSPFSGRHAYKILSLDIVLVLESGPEHLIGELDSEFSLIRAKKRVVSEAIYG